MSVKDALTSLVEILTDSEQRMLLLEASKMVQASAVPELMVLPEKPMVAIAGKAKPGKTRKYTKHKKNSINKGKKTAASTKLNTPTGPFTVFGVEKNSCRAVAMHFGITYGKFLHHIRKPNADMEEVIKFLSPSPEDFQVPEIGRVPVRRRPKAENMLTH